MASGTHIVGGQKVIPETIFVFVNQYMRVVQQGARLRVKRSSEKGEITKYHICAMKNAARMVL